MQVGGFDDCQDPIVPEAQQEPARESNGQHLKPDPDFNTEFGADNSPPPTPEAPGSTWYDWLGDVLAAPLKDTRVDSIIGNPASPWYRSRPSPLKVGPCLSLQRRRQSIPRSSLHLSLGILLSQNGTLPTLRRSAMDIAMVELDIAISRWTNSPLAAPSLPFSLHTLIYPETCPIMQKTNLESNEVDQYATPFLQMPKKKKNWSSIKLLIHKLRITNMKSCLSA